MTVAANVNRNSWAGDGSTVAFALGATFIFFDEAELRVVLKVDSTGVETLQALTTNYSVSGGSGATGTVTMVTAPAVGETLIIRRVMPLTQLVDLVNNSISDAEVVEDSFDKVIMGLQQLSEVDSRSIKFSEGSSNSDVDFPDPSALKLVRWNAAGTALELVDISTLGAVVTTAFTETFLDDTTANAAKETLEIYTTVISPAQITANQNNYAPTGVGTAAEIRVDSDAARDITGISASQTDGREIAFTNDGAFSITLKHNVTSTAANRFDFGDDADTEVKAGASVRLRYDGTASRWRLLGGAGGGAGGLEDAGGNIVGSENAQTTAGNFTVTNAMNLVTGGPFTIASGHTVTVGSGENWVIVGN